MQVEVGYCDFGTQSGEPLRVSPSETSRRTRDDRHLPVQLANDGSLLRPRPRPPLTGAVEMPVSGLSMEDLYYVYRFRLVRLSRCCWRMQ